MRLHHISALILLALLYASINALVPLQIDDAAYASYARQMATRPLDPYGFAFYWYDLPDAANDVLAPPVLPFSVAPAVWLFGERPILWKLALLPWVLLLAFVLNAHLRRFAAGLDLELTALLMLSPALLPSLNLMLDIPALALTLLSIHLFLNACDTNSVSQAILAGLITAIAMETKYTGVFALGAIAAATLVYGRWLFGLAAAVTAAQGFIIWEFLTAILYGRSHFLTSLGASADTFSNKANLIPVFFSQLGGVVSPVVLLGLVASGVRGRWLVAVGGAVVAAYAAVVLFDAHYLGFVHPSPRLFGLIEAENWDFQLAEILFDVIAAVGVILLANVLQRLMAEPAGPGRNVTWFLSAWLGVEAIGYLVLSPFPAVRRVLGVFVVLTFLFGRLAARTCRTPSRRLLVRSAVAFSAVLGLAFLAIDWLGARAHERGAEEAARFVQENGGGQMWYVGHWGFQYYAERCGMMPVVPVYGDRPRYVKLPPVSRLHRDDWLVVPDSGLEQPRFDLAAIPCREMACLTIDDPVPLRTVPCFYGGRTPLEHHEGPRLTVHIYRITEDCEASLPSL